MALVKSVQFEQHADPASNNGEATTTRRAAEERRRRARTMAKQQQAAERIATAATELASGITETSSAQEELTRSMEQVGSGAEQAAGAAQQNLTAVEQINTLLSQQTGRARDAAKKTDAVYELAESISNEIDAMVENVKLGAQRQTASVEEMTKLEQQASQIGEAVQAVMRIADQTNLLALNAAIEAGRAGTHGKGFAVVADTVRTLAETSETNAERIAKLVTEIQDQSNTIGASVRQAADKVKDDAEAGNEVVTALERMKSEMAELNDSSKTLAESTDESSQAAKDFTAAAENTAAAAEQQSSATEQSLKSLQQQSQALSEAEESARTLEELAEALKNSTDMIKSAEEVAASAEELSAGIEEINRSADEIATALGQIRQGAEQQAAAAEQAIAGVGQIEKGVTTAEERSQLAFDKAQAMSQLINDNHPKVERMIDGIRVATETSQTNLKSIQSLEDTTRKIDKIVDAIATVAVKISMLAVNGAVEAARAGEYGKGFAVVSSDIQNLADDASENVEQIKDLVKSIQHQALVVRNEITSISESALQSLGKADATSKDFQMIKTDINGIVEGSNVIWNGAKEIGTAVNQGRQGVEQVASAAEQARASTDQAATAAQQQAQGSRELATSTEEIASIADELQSG